MLKRIGLFLLVNLLVVVTISFILNIFQVRNYLTASGINYQSLLVFCLVWGMVGSFISLQLSRFMAKNSWECELLTLPNLARMWK